MAAVCGPPGPAAVTGRGVQSCQRFWAPAQLASARIERHVCRLLEPLREKVHTLTSDRGGEFQLHGRIDQRLGLTYYFARPHAAWERGTNENTNGLLRQYFPKQRNLLTVSAAEVRHTRSRLNRQLRKCLDFLTPFEVFFELTIALVT
ncbi:MAG TPA: IS30 family transposase [Anaerolineales bacterium]|nr:IS30 family transposase [Anaerolineales bacterium]